MSKRSYKPEEIVAKLRQVDVLHSQGATIHALTNQLDHFVGANQKRSL